MRRQSSTRLADRVISAFAGRQHGVVGRWQLLEAGVTGRQIRLRVASTRLMEIHRGVYLVGATPPPHAHEMAALLAYRLQAALSHRSAAALWELLPYPATAKVWVTIAPERSPDRPGVKAVRARLHARDIRHRDRLTITSPPRTILDCATLLGLSELERLVAEAAYQRLASEGELRQQLARNPRRRGNRSLRAVLGLSGGPRRTRSPAERALLSVLRDRGIDRFETNARVAGFEVDFLWRLQGLAVEVDGYDAHSGRMAFERDRLKVAKLNAAGIVVMPVTGRQIHEDPNGVVARLLRPWQSLETHGHRRNNRPFR